MPVKELYQNTYMISLRHGLHGQSRIILKVTVITRIIPCLKNK